VALAKTVLVAEPGLVPLALTCELLTVTSSQLFWGLKETLNGMGVTLLVESVTVVVTL
jgi:hypothetical protein